jgi:hypothetical protein
MNPTSRYWIDEVQQMAMSAGVVSIYSRYNDSDKPIRIFSCLAVSSGVIAAIGILFYRERAGKEIPVFFDDLDYTANETVHVPKHFVLRPGERIKVTFSSTAAATDILQLVAYGEYIEEPVSG